MQSQGFRKTSERKCHFTESQVLMQGEPRGVRETKGPAWYHKQNGGHRNSMHSGRVERFEWAQTRSQGERAAEVGQAPAKSWEDQSWRILRT
jgi:hypothetical protein